MNTMNESTSETKDSIYEMSVDKASALHAERNGETFYFCGDQCLQKFLSTHADTEPERKSGCCCG